MTYGMWLLLFGCYILIMLIMALDNMVRGVI